MSTLTLERQCLCELIARVEALEEGGVGGGGESSVGSNPTSQVSLYPVNGSATTFMRSDAAPPLDESISPTWIGTHIFSNPVNVPDHAYDSISWNGNLTVPTKNAIRDKIEALVIGGGGGGSGAVISGATDYTGGGSSGLDGEPTAAVAVPRIYNFKHTTLGWKQYLLRVGTEAESVPNIIRPDDYNASTNAKVFELMF